MVHWEIIHLLKRLKLNTHRCTKHNLQGNTSCMQGSYVHTCFCSKNDHGTSWYVPCWEAVGCWNQHVPQPSQIAVTEKIHFILPCSFPTPLGTAQHWTLWKRYKQNSVMDLWSSKQEQNLKSSWPILNVFDKIQSVQDSARFKGTTSYHIDLLGARNGIICMINHNHWKRSGRSITYSLFICMPEPGIWAQPNDWVVYFGSWNGLPKHAVAVHSVHMKIFAWLQVPRKLHFEVSELIVSRAARSNYFHVVTKHDKTTNCSYIWLTWVTGAPSKNYGLDLWPLNHLHIAALKRSPPTDFHGDHTRVPEACHVTEKLMGIYPELTPSKHSIHAN